MPDTPTFRFAPSPNGLLHLGHAYSALLTAHWAARLDGRYLLRIEDIDRDRSKPEFTEAIFEDLGWLGLTWPEPVMYQSDRFGAYRSAIDRLQDMGLLYPCFCTRAEIRAQIGAHADGRTDPDGAPIYPGTCRHLSRTEIIRRMQRGDPVQWRLATHEALEQTGMLTYSVAQPSPAGRPQIRYARAERWGDAVIKRKDMPASYHLSAVVDDASQRITHVTRGRDMEAATDIHVLLQFLLGLPTPIYTFHKLILDDEGNKLSKSIRSRSLRAMRESGWTAEAVRTHLGFDWSRSVSDGID